MIAAVGGLFRESILITRNYLVEMASNAAKITHGDIHYSQGKVNPIGYMFAFRSSDGYSITRLYSHCLVSSVIALPISTTSHLFPHC